MIYKTSKLVAVFVLLCSFSVDAQTERDTVYYNIESPMIDRAEIYEFNATDKYFIQIQVKDRYHADFAKVTGDNIGNDLAVKYEGSLIDTSFPTIKVKITSGRFHFGPYKTRDRAEEVRDRLVEEK